MAESAEIGGHKNGFLATMRTDNWRTGPILTVLGLGLFGVYATIMAVINTNYTWGPYLSPFYSPVLYFDPAVAAPEVAHHSWFGASMGRYVGMGHVKKRLSTDSPHFFRITCRRADEDLSGISG